jgi:type I restriction enzyme S subunit
VNSWPLKKLSEVALIERDSIQPCEIKTGTSYVGLEHIESGGDIPYVPEVSKGDLASSKFRFTSKHILYGKLRPYLAKIACPNFDGICSTDIVPILANTNMDKQYICYFLRQPKIVALANSRSTGANLPRLSPKALSEILLPVPPLHEQKRIAEILDRAEALRSKRRAALALLDELTQSIFLDMFGDPVTNPKGWDDSKTLADVSSIGSGITKGRRTVEPVRTVPYLAVVNVQDKMLDLSVVKTIEATEKEIDRYRLEKNDLVLTEGGDADKLGRGTLWNEEIPDCIHQNHIFRVRLETSDVTPVFLNWLVGGRRGKSYFLSRAKQTTGIATINMTQLKAFPMLIPPIELQDEFVRRILRIEVIRSNELNSLNELDALFASLQHRAFRGEL